MDSVLKFPTIWLPRGFNREKRVHESRIGTPGAMTGGMQVLSGADTQILGAAGPPASNLAAQYIGGTDTFQDTGLTTPAIADGDPVLGWKDQSGNARHVTRLGSTGGVLRTNVKNSRSAVSFEAAAAGLQSGSFTDNQPTTVYMAGNFTVASGFAWDGLNSRTMQLLWDSGNLYVDDGSGIIADNNHYSTNTFAIFTCHYNNGSSSSIAVNNTNKTTGNLTTNPTVGGFTIGNRGALNLSGRGKILEVLVYTANNSSTIDTSVYSYLSAKYSIP